MRHLLTTEPLKDRTDLLAIIKDARALDLEFDTEQRRNRHSDLMVSGRRKASLIKIDEQMQCFAR